MPRGGQAKQEDKTAKGKVRCTKTRPGGWPARPGQAGRAHAHTHGTRAWCPPTCKGRCRRPHETAPVHRPSPPSNDGRYGKPDASVTGSTHAKHRSASSPRPKPEGPVRDNHIAGPLTGTTPSEPSAPASAGGSGTHNEPGSRPASACPAQPPSKSGGESPRGGERHHGVGKAHLSTESDRTGRGAAHHAGPQGTPERHTAGHNNGQRTGAKQRRPPGAANPDSARHNDTSRAREALQSNTQPGRGRPPKRAHAAQEPRGASAEEQAARASDFAWPPSGPCCGAYPDAAFPGAPVSL